MRSLGALAAVFIAAGLAGCVVGRPFVNSSMDFNEGKMHQLMVNGDIAGVADAVTAIMKERGAVIVKRREFSDGALILSFRQEEERVRGARAKTSSRHFGSSKALTLGSSTTDVAYESVFFGSLYYVELNAAGERVTVEAVGLPVVQGRTACPELVNARFRACKPAQSSSEDSFAREVSDKLGVNVAGRKEADTIGGLMAELQSKKWVNQYSGGEQARPSPASPAPPSDW